MPRMHRSALVLLASLATPLAAQEIVSAPRPGEQETAQAGGGTGRFGFVGALRCPAGLAMVGVRVAEGPLLNFLQLGCAPIACESGQCRWRPGSVTWGPEAGARAGAEAAHLCPPVAVVSGFRAGVTRVPGGDAVSTLAVQCAPLSGVAADGAFAIGPATDLRTTRTVVPAGRAPARAVEGGCRDRAAAAFSVAVGAYPPGLGGQGAHVRALSLFCSGLTQ
jgi:hypothetical protein